MIRKPTPIQLSGAALEEVKSQLNTQTIVKSTPKSVDPVKFPVFEVQPSKRVLIYVPEHTIETATGIELRMDTPLIHTIKEGKRYHSYRCVSGLRVNDENGNPIYDGTCPFCEGTDVPWDLANLTIKHKCNQMGLDPEDKENDQVKSIRSSSFSGRVIKEPNRYFTFPIVVIKTVNDDGKTIAKDENGKPTLTPMWYHISEAQYVKKWETTLEGMEDEPVHPGGHFFTLNFSYDTKGKDANKRDAAQNLNVIARNIKADKLKAAMDEATASWTPEKAREMVISNQLYSMADMQDVVDEVLEDSKEMLSLLKATEESGNTSTGYDLKAPADTEVKALGSISSGVGETDEDFDLV